MNERMRAAARAGSAKFKAIAAMTKGEGGVPRNVGELAERMARLDEPAPGAGVTDLLYAMMPERLLVVAGSFAQFKGYQDRFPVALRGRLKFVSGEASLHGNNANRTRYVTIGDWLDVDSKRHIPARLEERGIARWGATAWS